MGGFNASHRLETVGWEVSKIAATTCWVMFCRQQHNTIATDVASPTDGGRPPEETVTCSATRVTSASSCSSVYPVIAWRFNGPTAPTLLSHSKPNRWGRPHPEPRRTLSKPSDKASE